MGVFSQNLMVTTLYTNLGDEAICHGIQETEVGQQQHRVRCRSAVRDAVQVSLVITSHSLLPKLRAILTSGKCPRVETVIFMEDPNFSTDTEGFPESVKVFSFQSVVRSVCSWVYPLYPPCPGWVRRPRSPPAPPGPRTWRW